GVVGCGALLTGGCTPGYPYSTPFGVGWVVGAPWRGVVPPAIHIQPLRGWLGGGCVFDRGLYPRLSIFNPCGVVKWGAFLTGGCTPGYSYSTPAGLVGWWVRFWPGVAPPAIHIQPLRVKVVGAGHALPLRMCYH